MSEAAHRVRIDLSYDGTGFAGWQVQPGLPTVQGLLEDAVSRVNGARRTAVHGAGRTDAGVHARGQVAHCDLSCGMSDGDLEYRLRRILPPEIRPLRVRTVAPDFHARKDARAKTYRYRLDLTRSGDPFLARFALHHPFAVDRSAVEDALGYIAGRHDWSGFTASACTVKDRVRELSPATFEVEGDQAWFTFTADGFLQYMVRNLVGTLLEIGGRRMQPVWVERILESGDRELAGPTAPARGLVLWQVAYPEDSCDASQPR